MTFGDFTSFCHTAPLPLCASVGAITSISNGVGIETNCYARNIELANTIIFQMAASAIHIVALVMTVVMILHVRGKFTAVGMFCSVDNDSSGRALRWVRSLRNDGLADRIPGTLICRPKGDHHLLLHLHDPHLHFPGRGRGSDPSWLECLSIFRRVTEWVRLGSGDVPAHQRFCGLPTLRGWDTIVVVDATSLLARSLRHLVSGVFGDLQELGRLGPDQHGGTLRRLVFVERRAATGVSDPSDYLGDADLARSVATR